MSEQNPLLAKLRIPGRTFQLPSRGALYNNGELGAVANGEIHVYPLSALAEINLKNPDTLFNGKAVEAVFGECIPDIKKPTELFARDIDAIMLFLRLVTYGPNFEISVKHTCKDAKDHSYIVDLEQQLQKMVYLDPTVIEEKYSCTLQNGQVVRVHPLKFNHMIELFQLNANKSEFTEEQTKANIVFNLKGVIESVDGVSDPKLIEPWIRAASTPMHNRVTEAFERTNEWGPVSTVKLTCKDCGEQFDVELPMNPISFFTE
jgi:hypothetical protein